MKILERDMHYTRTVNCEGNSHSLEAYLKRRPTEVLEVVLNNHLEGVEKLDEKTVKLIEQILCQREKGE